MSIVERYLGDRMADPSSPMNAGVQLAGEVIDLLREIRDQVGEGEAARSTQVRRVVGVDVVGGVGRAQIQLPAGVAYNLESWAAEIPGINGRLSIYVGGEDPANLIEVATLPTALVAGTARASGAFVGGEYVPASSVLFFLVEGVGTDGRAVVGLKGKAFVAGDPVDTNQGSTG